VGLALGRVVPQLVEARLHVGVEVVERPRRGHDEVGVALLVAHPARRAVEAEALAVHVLVEIEDDGAGIPQKIQARIFDPFFTSKEPGKGTGLGLSISYSIVTDKHKGEISVASQPGSTCFTIKLPIAGPGLAVS
jgi:signal transduction histidine kinase